MQASRDLAVAGFALGLLGYVLAAAFLSAVLEPFRSVVAAGVLAAPLPLAARLLGPRVQDAGRRQVLRAACNTAFTAAALASGACLVYYLLYGAP